MVGVLLTSCTVLMSYGLLERQDVCQVYCSLQPSSLSLLLSLSSVRKLEEMMSINSYRSSVSPGSPEDWRPGYLHSHTAVIVSQPGATVELAEPDLLVVDVRVLVLHELSPRDQEIVLGEIILGLLTPGLLLVAVLATTDEFLQINS